MVYDILYHPNDVFHLTDLLDPAHTELSLPDTVRKDMAEFIEKMRVEDVDLKQLGVYGEG